MHNNYLELRAVREAICSAKFSKVFIRIFSDNMSTVHMLNKLFTTVAHCALELKQILTYTLAHDCALKAYHVPGRLNTVADYLSRQRVAVQRVSDVVCDWLASALATPLTCDRFASDSDHILPYYNTFMPLAARFPVDAFAQHDWLAHCNWCHPPPQIIDKLVYFLDALNFEPKCVIYCPYWPAHSWFSTLLSRSGWVLRVGSSTPPLL